MADVMISDALKGKVAVTVLGSGARGKSGAVRAKEVKQVKTVDMDKDKEPDQEKVVVQMHKTLQARMIEMEVKSHNTPALFLLHHLFLKP